MEREITGEKIYSLLKRIYPICRSITGDGVRKTLEIVKTVDQRLNIHDFRIVPGTTHCNLIFDVAAPFELKLGDDELAGIIADKIHREDGYYFAVITVDRQ